MQTGGKRSGLGNILAAVYAKAMGIPFRRFTVAANQNNVLSDFLESGLYDLRERRLHTTISPSIDILTSSNLERMLHLLCTCDSGRPFPFNAVCLPLNDSGNPGVQWRILQGYLSFAPSPAPS